MPKELKDKTFDELVVERTNDIMTGLIEGGGHGLRTQVYLALNEAVQWERTRIEEEAKKTKKTKKKTEVWKPYCS